MFDVGCWMFGLLHSFPLTLTLSPSAKEREQPSTPPESSCDARFGDWLTTMFPLPFRRGEGQGENSPNENFAL